MSNFKLGVCDNARKYISIVATSLSQLSKILSISIITFTKSNCLTYKCSKNTIIEAYYKEALPPRCVTMFNKVLCIFYYSKIANTGHQSYMFSIVHNSIQKLLISQYWNQLT